MGWETATSRMAALQPLGSRLRWLHMAQAVPPCTEPAWPAMAPLACQAQKLGLSLLLQYLQTSGRPWSWLRGPARGGRPVRSVQLLRKLVLWLPAGTL